MPLTVGGGVRTVDDIKTLLLAGADKVSINTRRASAAAISSRKRPRNSATSASWSRSTPSGVKRAGGSDRWEIFTHGGRNPTGIDAIECAQEVVALGAGEILLTSMDRDGTGRASTSR